MPQNNNPTRSGIRCGTLRPRSVEVPRARAGMPGSGLTPLRILKGHSVAFGTASRTQSAMQSAMRDSTAVHTML